MPMLVIKDQEGLECFGCGRKSQLTRHHIVPKRSGGGNEPENIVILCRRCHRAQHKGKR